MTKILLLDSNSLINRAYYALPPLANRQGVFTNAVYGYLSMLAKLINDHKPTHIAAIFDLKAPTFRHKMYDLYKATRKPMQPELASQLPILKELLEALGVKILTKEGYEADDIIGTLAKRFDEDTIIVSGDRDVLQLVDDNTCVFNTKRGVSDIKVYDLLSLEEEGFTPKKIIEYKALAGDHSDNIPGAPGVGDKTAINLLNTYGGLDGIYLNIDQIKGKLREKLIDNKDIVYLSRELATINTDAPIECELSDIIFENAPKESFFTRLNELEIKSLASRFGKKEEKNNDLPFNVEDTPKKIDIKIKEISDFNDLVELLNGDFSAISLNIGNNITFSFDGNTEYIVHCSESLFDLGIAFDDAIMEFKKVLESKEIIKIMFDVKANMKFFKGYDITINLPYEDVLLKGYLLNSTNTIKSVNDLLLPLGYENYISAGIYNISTTQDADIKKKELTSLYNDIEKPLIEVLFDMEEEGFTINLSVLNALAQKYTEEIKALTEKIYELAGTKFNINSPQQMGNVLFERLGLPHGKKTKTGYSVSADILEELDHPIVTEILRYRQLSKLHSTYIEGMRSVMDKSGKVHTVFKQCLTATGRLSSTEPNLQNIPNRTEEGREIRKMFVPSEGNVLVTADYSQIELRLLAHFSEDPVLIEAYNEGKDIHSITASKIYGVPLEDVTKSMRTSTKAVNFGIIYGISAFGLAKNIGVAPWQAKEFVDKYFLTYPCVRDYMQSNADFARENYYIKTLAGRLRYFPELRSPNKNIRNFGERAAMNMPLQGSSADIIKIAMINVYNALKNGGFKAKLILQVHDELVIDCPIKEMDAVKKLLQNEMEKAVTLKVPLIADAKSGSDWYSVD